MSPSPLIVTVVLYLAGLGAAGQFSKLAVGFVALLPAYGDRAAALGLAISLISLVGVALGLVAGMVVGRVGYRRALLWSLGAGAVLSLLQASLPALPILMATRVAEGLSHVLIVVSAPTLISEATGERSRTTALTVWSTFFAVAFALTALLGTPLVAAFGPASLILAHAAWMAVAALLVAWTLPPRPRAARAGRGGTDPGTAEPSLLSRHLAAYSTPAIAAPALGWLCYTLTFVAVLTALPLLVPAGTGPALAAAAPLVSIAAALSLGVALLGRFPARRVAELGFVASALGAVGFVVSGYAPAAALFLFAAMGLVQGSGFAMVPQLNARLKDRALANGALAQMGNVGNLAGTPLLLALHGLAPAAGPLAFLLCAYGAGALLLRVIGARAARIA